MNRSCGNGRVVSSLLSLLLSTEARLSGGEKSVKWGERQCKINAILFHDKHTVVATLSVAGLVAVPNLVRAILRRVAAVFISELTGC
jgi:hypothetical protein